MPEGFEFALEFESVAFERVEAFEDEAVTGVEVCDLFVDVDAVSTPRAFASASGVGAVVGGYERGSTRMRETSKGVGSTPGAEASRRCPAVETVTLRALTASPMRMTGSLVMRAVLGSTCGAICSSEVVVGQEGLVARRGLVAAGPASCARGARCGSRMAHETAVAEKILRTEERIGLSAHVRRNGGGESRRG